MKNLKFLPLVILTLGLVLSSCKKDPEDRIPGDWNINFKVTETYTEPGEPTETETYQIGGSASFDKDGTGTITIGGDLEALTWTATETKVNLVIDGEVIVFDVIENERKRQVWKSTESYSLLDYTYETVYEITMDKK